MWKRILMVLTVLVSAVGQADVEIGNEFPVPVSHWVNVVEPIANADRDFNAGDKCLVRYGANVTVVKLSEDNSKALLRYGVAGTQNKNYCPAETLFALESEIVQKFPEYARAHELRDRHLQTEVIRVIAKMKDGDLGQLNVGMLSLGDTLRVPGRFNVALGRTTRNSDGILNFGQSCLVEEGGVITVLSFNPGRTRALVAYEIDGDRNQDFCPTGTLFAVDVDKIRNLEKTDWASDVKAIAQLIEKADADVVALQLTNAEKAKIMLDALLEKARETGVDLSEKTAEAREHLAAATKEIERVYFEKSAQFGARAGETFEVARERGAVKAEQIKEIYLKKSAEYGTKVGESLETFREVAAVKAEAARHEAAAKAQQIKDGYFKKSADLGAKAGEAYFRVKEATPGALKKTKEEIGAAYSHVTEWISKVTHWDTKQVD